MLPAAVSEDGPCLPEQQHYPEDHGSTGGGGRGFGTGPSRLHQVAMADGGQQVQHHYGSDAEHQYGGGDYGQYGEEYSEAAAAAAAYGAAVGSGSDGGVYSGRGGDSYDGGDGSSAAANSAATAGWPADPEGMLSLLQQQRGQYRSWVAQCAVTALAALDLDYESAGPVAAPVSLPEAGSGGEAEGGAAAHVPGDVPGMVAAMDVAGQARHYLLMLKAAAESAREAGRALYAFEALSLPPPDLSEGGADPAVLAVGEAAEAEYVSAAYAVTTAISNAAAQVEALQEHCGSAENLLRQLDTSGGEGAGATDRSSGAVGLEAPLSRRLAGIGLKLAGRLRREAAELLTALRWPPPLAKAEAEAGTSPTVDMATEPHGEGAFAGFEAHPVLARRLVGVLTALTHFQMAVEQRPAFLRLLAGPQRRGRGSAASGYEDDGAELQDQESDGSEEEEFGKPILWAAQVLAEPVSRRLRSHFHPGAPTGRLDRPAWLFATSLSWLRRHGHCLAALDDMLACLQLKPHYNMPAEFTRAVQEEVLALLREVRLPALMAATAEAERQAAEAAEGGGEETDAAAAVAEAAAAAGGLWFGLMDAAAAWDIALLPLLGAGGQAVEAAAARAGVLLEGYARAGDGARGTARACDALDPVAAGGTSDMHARFVAVAAVAAGAPAMGAAAAAMEGALTAGAMGQQRSFSPALAAWAAAEGGAALRAVEAAAYDDSCLLASAEEATTRALGLSQDLGDSNNTSTSASAAAAISMAAGAAAPPGPWQRDTWPPVLAAEAAAVLDGLVARSRWLAAAPAAQAAWLEAAAGPLLGLLKRRLGRLVEVAVASGDALGEAGLPKVCAALCAARHLDDHLHSLLLTELAPLVAALARLNAAAGQVAAGGTAAGGSSVPGSPASRGTGAGAAAAAAGKLGSGSFWGGLLAAAGGGAGAASPAHRALQDGVTALAGGTSLASAALGAGAAGGGASGGPLPPVLGEYVAAFGRLHRDGCLKLAREVALGFGRHSVAYRHAIEANPQFPFLPDEDLDEALNGGRLGGAEHEAGSGGVRPAASITPSFAPALLFLQTTLHQLSRACDKVTFADVWRGAALSINRFVFNFIATESRFTRAGARQFAADVAGLAQLFAPYTRRGGAGGGQGGAAAAGGQHFRELQAAARLLCLGDEEAADVMRRASAAAVAARAAATSTPSKSSRPRSSPSKPHSRSDPVRVGMASDPVLSAAGMAVLSPLQIMNVIEHRI
ncbi:hypothetical protein HYH02_014873 [Chlamydomonas schloesseri]|uniref:Uncharacterized protein n=1 Tax=Chlamydomonas schloesseri TaxID=2026947 RepID=A0A835VUB2_9CHLO|nr:hypothetical protein HYH02_014873 [Chlamydomonas schloesseri]|eukprot:KAG2426118.1 hypothetical protein HYH02_014873 [Chlamydomonas schloesseri]